MGKHLSDTPKVNGLHPTDIHVGQSIANRRFLLGLTQQDLARSLGITYQQVQKYERGLNRVSASRLYEISLILGVEPSQFFAGLPGQSPLQDCDRIPDANSIAPDGSLENLPYASPSQRESLELVRSFTKITAPETRKYLLNLVRSISTKS